MDGTALSTRITSVEFKDLTLEHLHLLVEVNCRAGQLVGWDQDEILLGPQADIRRVPVHSTTLVLILDAPKISATTEFNHFGWASKTEAHQ